MVLSMAAMGLILSGPLSAQGLAAAKANFSQWDKRLNAVYVDLKKTLPEDLFEKVRSDQRDWVEHRDYIAEWDSRAQGKVPAENTQPFHGARAYFEGRFLRVQLLSGKPADQVVAAAFKGGWSE